jgi:hypothetical protein
MKIIKLFLITVLAISASTLFAQTTKTETIKVWGNCTTCKKNIEKAALTDGVTNAVWNKDTKYLTVTYNTAKTSNETIQKKVAAVGYDTEKYKGDDKAYNNLDECCQYNRKKEKK